MNTRLTLDEILAPSRIAAAWSKLRANDGAPGEDAVTIRDLEEGLPHLWPRIESSIRNGTYLPAPLRPVRIPKPCGGTRKLAIPSVIDRLIQHAISSAMALRWDARFPDSSYAYRPGVGAHQAIDGVLSVASSLVNPVALRMDIRDFFDRIPHRLIAAVLRETPCDEASGCLIHRSLAASVASPLGPLAVTEGIPQGSPLSPLMANAVLLPFDRSFAAAPLFRYADDMLVLCTDEAAARSMLDRAEKQLALLGLELNAAKTRILPLADAAFLGFGFMRDSGRWVRGLSSESRAACHQHLRRMEDSGKSLAEMAVFLRQWSAYFIPGPEDRARHAAFLRETCAAFRLQEPESFARNRSSPPPGFSYSGRSQSQNAHRRIPWALRFLLRRVRFGLNFRRKGFIPVPSGFYLNIGGHRFHIRF